MLRLHHCPTVYLHIKAKDDRVLRSLLLPEHGCLLDVLLVHLADANVKDRNLHILKEGQQRLERTQCTCLHEHALGLPLEAGEDALEARADLLPQLLSVVPRTHDAELRARHRPLEAGRADPDARGRADLGVPRPGAPRPRLPRGHRGLERADRREDRAADARNDNLVALVQGATHQDHVDCRPEAFDFLDLDHGTLKLLLHLQPAGQERLVQIENLIEKVGHALSGQSACRDDGDA
mmetsp:Transcript_111854/g.316418  ORF Transcript_111854/g.316418 Transcript_111854/m.316418 type:complete len:237 (+) Transcript_111854:791-1501(+)